jgi:hypothetical protein
METIKNKKIYLPLVIFLALDFLLLIFLIFPFFNKIKEDSKEIIIQRDKFFSLSAEKEEFEKNKESIRKIRNDLAKFDNLFINPKLPLIFIDFLEKEAAENQLSIEISPLLIPSSKNEPWSFLSFQVKNEGSFPSFLKFLTRIENGPYLLEVTDLKLERVSEKEVTDLKLERVSEKELKTKKIKAIFTIRIFTK